MRVKLETATGLKRALLIAAERTAAACVHRVLCNSASIRDEAMTLGIASPAKLHLLGSGSSNGVDPERFSPGPTDVRMRLGLSDDAPVLGFVGRFTRDKGIPELLQAFETISIKVPHARLLLVGWFDDSEDALDQSTRNRIVRHPHILRTGFVTDTSLYYRAMDMLILPTWREGFPNAVLEASASGIPVITTLCTGSRDSVVPEVTGLLIPPGYPEAITEAVLKLLRDPARSKRMGEAGRRWVSSQFRDETVLQLAVSFYKSLVEVGAAERESVEQDPVHYRPTEHQLTDQAPAKKGPARQEPSAQPGKGVKSA